jgi:hypothetical protein
MKYHAIIVAAVSSPMTELINFRCFRSFLRISSIQRINLLPQTMAGVSTEVTFCHCTEDEIFYAEMISIPRNFVEVLVNIVSGIKCTN